MSDGLEAFKRLTSRQQIAEEAEQLSCSFKDFVRAAWPIVKPDDVFMDNWHIGAVCERLSAVSCGEIFRLQVWLPPITMKSWLVTIFWPAWEWTTQPSLKYWTASYETRFSGRLSSYSRNLMMTSWYQERWGDKFAFIRDAEHHFSNDRGGTRLATSPESTGTGEHGHRIIIDDPINAQDADATSKTVLGQVNEWYNGTVNTRGLPSHARVIVMQRLHENDLAGHVLSKERWEVLCLPERHEVNHPFVWPDDPRSEGDLLWPAFRTSQESDAMAAGLTSYRAAGQMQQRPAAREGEILKRNWWRFYDPKILTDEKRKPKFRAVVQTVDTPLKDKESNDLVAIQVWGVIGADRYLLEARKGHANYSQAKRWILEQARWARKMFPTAAHHVLLENAGYGVELIVELKREIGGVVKINPGLDGNKILRAESASADLESGNCWLPGEGNGADKTLGPPNEAACSADVVDFVNSSAQFPNAIHDDDVDAWSQVMNWLRSRNVRPAKTSSPFRRPKQPA